jgi:hypothetical protein
VLDHRAVRIDRFVFPEIQRFGDPFLSVALCSLTIARYSNRIWHGDRGAVVEQAATVKLGKDGVSRTACVAVSNEALRSIAQRQGGAVALVHRTATPPPAARGIGTAERRGDSFGGVHDATLGVRGVAVIPHRRRAL